MKAIGDRAREVLDAKGLTPGQIIDFYLLPLLEAKETKFFPWRKTTKSKVEQIIDRRQVRLRFHSVTRKVSGGLQYAEAASPGPAVSVQPSRRISSMNNLLAPGRTPAESSQFDPGARIAKLVYAV